MRWFVLAMLVGCGGTLAGEDGACTVEDHGNGTATMTCPDGTIAELGAPTVAGGDTDISVDTDVPVDTDASGDTDTTSDCGLGIVVHGSYTVENDLDLPYLRCVREITGNLTVTGTSQTTLAGLEALTTVGGTLYVLDNKVLTSLTGLGALTFVGGRLQVAENKALTSLAALNALTTVGGSLFITGNPALTTLSGLDAVAFVGGDLWVSSNPALISLAALSSLTAVGGDIRLYSNTALCQSQVDALDARLSAACVSCGSNKPGC